MMTTTRLTVRGYHCDAYGHVNNARWLELFEEARWRLLEQGGRLADFHARGLIFIVVRIEVDYRQPAVPGDMLEIRSQMDHLGGRSAVIRQTAVRLSADEQGSEETAVEAAITFVVVDRKTGKPVPLVGEVRKALSDGT